MLNIVLVGAGGHCKACLDVLSAIGEYNVAALVDRPENLGKKLLGITISHTDEDLPSLIARYSNLLICLGQIKTPEPRKVLYNNSLALGASFPVHISPYAYASPSAQIGAGTIIMHHAMLNAEAKVGANCIINSKALLEHEVSVGDHCHVSTGALINGGSTVEGGCFIGSQACIGQGVLVGNNSIIGAGAIVLKDVPPGSKIVGVWA